MLKNQFLKSEITLYPPYMSVERVGISKKSENHIQKKSTPFLWTSFQGVGKSPPGWDFPPTSLLLRGVGFQPGGRFPPHPLHPINISPFGFVSHSVSNKKVKVLRRQCCLSPYPSYKIFLSIVNIAK